jgi:hypothetical protein
MSHHFRFTPQSVLDRELQTLQELRSEINHLSSVYRQHQVHLLERTRLTNAERAVVIACLVMNGARVRWGFQGWQIEESGTPVPCDIVDSLGRAGLIESDEGVLVRSGSKTKSISGRCQSLIEDLLCDEWSHDFDRVSRLVLRYQKEMAIFELLSSLRKLYGELLAIPPEDYSRRFANRFRWCRAISGLYVAAFMNALAVGESWRLSIARNCLATIAQLIPGALDQL